MPLSGRIFLYPGQKRTFGIADSIVRCRMARTLINLEEISDSDPDIRLVAHVAAVELSV